MKYGIWILLALGLFAAACGQVDQSVKNAVNTLGQAWSVVGVRVSAVDVNLRSAQKVLKEADEKLAAVTESEDTTQAEKLQGTLAQLKAHLEDIRKKGERFNQLKERYNEERTKFNEYQTRVNHNAVSTRAAQEDLGEYKRRYKRVADDLFRTSDDLQKAALAYNALVNQLALDQRVFTLEKIEWKEV
jgi:chromosome segregation ATPase